MSNMDRPEHATVKAFMQGSDKSVLLSGSVPGLKSRTDRKASVAWECFVYPRVRIRTCAARVALCF